MGWWVRRTGSAKEVSKPQDILKRTFTKRWSSTIKLRNLDRIQEDNATVTSTWAIHSKSNTYFHFHTYRYVVSVVLVLL